MNRFGLSAAQWRAVTATLCSSHRVRVRAQLLNLEGEHLASLTPQLLDGQVDVDWSADATRRATIVIDDRRRALPFDSDSPSGSAFWFDRMIRVAYDVFTDGFGWLTLVPFTGPVVGLSRDGRQVTVTCDGMERLAMGNTWTVLALDKGMRKTDAIRRIMRELVGESRFDIPDLPATLPRPVTLTPDDVPWVHARRIALSMDRQLFYTGGGVLTLRRHPEHVAFEFTGRKHVLSSPQVTGPSDFGNAARVIGHDPKGPKRQLVAQAVASGPLSPSRLGHNGVPRYLMAGGSTVEVDNAKTRDEVRAHARRELLDGLRQPVQVSFEALPGPGAFLDPGDKCRVSVDEGAVTFRLTQLSMPLNVTSGQGMTVGYNDHRMGRGRPRVRVHRRPPAKRKHHRGDASVATETGRVQVVYTANVGSPLAADVAAGATVITVDDTSDFDTDGTLRIAGQTVGYSAVDDDTGQVTLTAAVTGAADAGDVVTLWDTGLDRAAVEHRAHVALPGVLDNADAVDATIRHTLIGYLDEGIRTPGTGESVRMERHGSDWVIVDVFGKQPAFRSDVVSGGGGGGGGPVAAARFEDIQPTPSYGSGGIIPSELNGDTVVGDTGCWVYDGSYGVRFTSDGWYQASADGHVFGLNDGDVLAVEVILHVTGWFGEVIGFGVAKTIGGTPESSDVWLSATSPVFYAQANNYVEMSVDTVNLTSGNSVIELCGINLVRL